MKPGTLPRWEQVNIAFASNDQAERATVTHLGPVFQHAESAGIIGKWFFIRKPQWRFRYLPATTGSAGSAKQIIQTVADEALNAGHALRWATAIYEPEIHAFGGDTAISTAHALFHQDSRHVLTYLGSPPALAPGRREISLLLCTAMMTAARLDRFERGDVWAQVAALRPHPSQAPRAQEWAGFKVAVQRLIATDTSPVTAHRAGGAVQPISAWLTAFENNGAMLRNLADNGELTRGLRAVLAHHVIFHWNRIGLPARTQANLAHAAAEASFSEVSGVFPIRRFTTAPGLPHRDCETANRIQGGVKVQGFGASEIDTTRPHPARMYDAYLGGKDNYPVDREAVRRILRQWPEVRLNARANLAFLQRAVRFLAGEAEIRQFIDIGTGIPAAGNVHEVAAQVAPGARVVYVDNDPIVHMHANALPTGSGTTTVVLADLRDPHAILAHPELRAQVDFSRPVALLLVAILHVITSSENPAGIIATLRDALPEGSYLALPPWHGRLPSARYRR
jgi:thiopeptide-type bacteriocin biosynthesis protein